MKGPLAAATLSLLAACACSAPSTAMDAAVTDTPAITDTPDIPDAPDVPEDLGPPPPQGSTEALLREACAGRPRRGEPFAFAYSTAPAMISGALRNLREGDLEAVHLVVDRPVRVARRWMMFRGMKGGRVRVRVTDDYGRSNPDTERDLVEPLDVAFTTADPVELTLPTPLDLHPARHAWVVVEHAAEPMGLAVAASRGGSTRSYVHSEWQIDQLAAMGGDAATFRWVQLSGAGGVALEYAVEARGESICPRQGAPWFTDDTPASGLRGTTNQISAVDLDGDGRDELVGTRTTSEGMTSTDALQVWRRRAGVFEDLTASLGLTDARGRMSLWGDFDGDGDADVYAGVYRDGVGPFTPASQSRVWMREGERFTLRDDALEPVGPTAAGSVADCDNDGVLDLAVGQWLRQYPRNPAPDFLLRGLGSGRFQDVSQLQGLPARSDGRPTYGMSWGDWDNDGDLDLFVANYGGNPNDLWRNDGRCQLTNVARMVGAHGDEVGSAGTSFGVALADYDNDGDLDAYETNIAHPRYDQSGVNTDHSRLLRNTGAPDYRFTDVAVDAGVIFTEGEISSAWGDYDNDGDLDLYVACTYPYEYSRLYRQEADHRFTDVTWPSGTQTENNGRALWLDVDRDGRLDLLTAPNGAWTLHRNGIRNANHWIALRLTQPTGNTAALGARITVRDAAGATQLREVSGGGATWGTQDPGLQHVGLGAQGGDVAVTVRWPDGRTSQHTLAVDRAWRIPRDAAPTALP